MSRIYEALLRAEQERTGALTPHAQPSVPQLPPPLNVQAANLEDPIAANAQIAQTGPTRLDLSAVAQHVWTPALEKLPALEERGSAVEQFRSLRTRLFGLRDLNPLKSILIGSALPREGKSFIAANLAISLARHKSSRVLLIDGDMRRSALHHLLGCPTGPGLTDYLAGSAGIVEIMQRATPNPDGSPLPAGLGSLTFIAAGEQADKAADLSGSVRFKQLIDTLAPCFDWIVVDSTPVNLVTDGVDLATSCDAVLLVARAGVTRFPAAQRALSELKASRILGVVLNAVETPPTVDGYFGFDISDSSESAHRAPGPIAP